MADSGSPPIVCPGHQKAIVGLHYSPKTKDGYFLISATHDKVPMLRDGTTGDWIGTFEGHKGAVWDAKLNGAATLAATAGADFTAKLWDATTGDLIHTFNDEHIVRALDFSPDGRYLVAGGKKKVGKVWSVEAPGEPVVSLPHASPITKVLWSPDGKTIVTGAEDGGVRVWEASSGNMIKEISVGLKAINDMEISHDHSLITVAMDNQVHIFEVNSLKPVKQFKFHFPCEAASVHPSNKWLLVGGSDMAVHLIEMESGKEINSFRGHHGPVHCVRWHPEGTTFSSGSGDATIRIWQAGV